MAKTLCVTGATSGIGLAALRRFASEGWHVVAVGRRADRLDALHAEYPAVTALPLDVRDREAVLAAFAKLPAIDVLINSAGLALGLEPAQAASLDDWETMIDTNIKGLMYCTRALLPGMAERRSGHVFNIGSVAGSYAYPGGNTYGATKAFVEQFSRNMRCDLHGTGVRVTNIEPGLLETEFSTVRFKGNQEAADKVYKGCTPLNADDIAESIWWAANLPAHVNINRLEIMPVCQSNGPLQVFKTL